MFLDEPNPMCGLKPNVYQVGTLVNAYSNPKVTKTASSTVQGVLWY